MESTHILAAVTLMIFAGITVINGCDMADMAKCTSIAPEAQTADAICKAGRESMKCIQGLLDSCAENEAAKAMLEPVMKGMKENNVCPSEDSNCEMTKLQGCSAKIPKEMPNEKEICSTHKDLVQTAVTCFDTYLPDCADSNIGASMKPMTEKLSTMLKKCDVKEIPVKGNNTDAMYETKDGNNKKEEDDLAVSVNGTTSGNSTHTGMKDKKVNGGAASLQASTMILSMLAVPVFVQVFVQVFGRL